MMKTKEATIKEMLEHDPTLTKEQIEKGLAQFIEDKLKESKEIKLEGENIKDPQDY